MRKLTKKWLVAHEACNEFTKWFNRVYPTGLVLNKKNIIIAIDKMLKKREIYHISGDLSWFIHVLANNDNFTPRLVQCYWFDISRDEMIEAFWADLDQLLKK